MSIKILISRTDRAGDLILTLPLCIYIKKYFPKSSLYFHLRSYTLPLIHNFRFIDKVIIDDNYSSVFALAKRIKYEKIDFAIIVHPTFRAVFATWLAKVKSRIGRASNVWQIFLNNRIIQHRSKNQKHELEYNLDLLFPVFESTKLKIDFISSINEFLSELQTNSKGWLLASEENIIKGKKILQMHGIEHDNSSKIIAIHPMHGGSAINLPVYEYRKLIEILLHNGLDLKVIVTLGRNEEEVMYELPPPKPNKFAIITKISNLAEYMGIIHNCQAFVGGSTGPTHIAAAIGKRTYALFPLLPTTTHKRWGPVGKNVKIVLPSGIRCIGSCAKCIFYNCMSYIDIYSLAREIISDLNSF